MSTPPYQVLKANHTGLTVSSLSQSLKFWHDLLGFPILYQHTASGPLTSAVVGVPNAVINVAMLEVPGGHHRIELEEYTSPSAEARKTFRSESCDVGNVHVALEVKGLNEMLDRMKDLKWVSLSEPQLVTKGRYDGWRLVFVRGPDGETVELMEVPASAT
ncbi:Glyoxalase/Bleomycin resistance protein/Dihydroxybiphenyl dioxygenase [Rhizodiscina lignyota]|uniref:Glyoxalase/Bleomycin resistance protein/Dihydroxybiphenyl dioxygenase n=1 Tax=Rhizodiscina lignyota TaxID=1504668 RepID=A0A9P4IAE1_9PEZI|nr:Glyoxalase/Bleomycin resistance protein/Dihydroxybiphenyl dioxygenase [Rhizodiscina lignyota]